jgi:hypothetical protein
VKLRALSCERASDLEISRPREGGYTFGPSAVFSSVKLHARAHVRWKNRSTKSNCFGTTELTSQLIAVPDPEVDQELAYTVVDKWHPSHGHKRLPDKMPLLVIERHRSQTGRKAGPIARGSGCNNTLSELPIMRSVRF